LIVDVLTLFKTMLTEKDITKITLTPVKKTNGRVIPIKKSDENKSDDESEVQEDKKKLLPPLTPFNTGYKKGRDNDPL